MNPRVRNRICRRESAPRGLTSLPNARHFWRCNRRRHRLMSIGNALFRERDHHFADEWGSWGSPYRVGMWADPFSEIQEHNICSGEFANLPPHQRPELYGHRGRNRSPSSSSPSAQNCLQQTKIVGQS